MAKVITIEGKRPADATPAVGLKLREAGLTYREIGKLWGISGARVFQILHPKLRFPPALEENQSQD